MRTISSTNQTAGGNSSTDQMAGGNGAQTQRVGVSTGQIFCLARSVAKNKPGETPLTQMTPTSQARHNYGKTD